MWRCPRIAHDVHTTESPAIWVVNAYQLASLISLLPLAAMGDRVGHGRMCRIGLVLFVIASLLCAISQTLPELAAARALQGFGGACIMSVNAALVRFIYPSKELGRGIALNGLVVALGVALGPTVAAAVLAVASWKWLFLINLPLGGAALYFAVTALPVTPVIQRGFDYVSTILLAAGLGTLFVGLDSFAHSSGVVFALALLVIGIISLVALVRRQIGRMDPLLPIDLLASPGFRGCVSSPGSLGLRGRIFSSFPCRSI